MDVVLLARERSKIGVGIAIEGGVLDGTAIGTPARVTDIMLELCPLSDTVVGENVESRFVVEVAITLPVPSAT